MADHLPLPHLVLPGPNENLAYTTAGQGGGGESRIPPRNRAEHAEYLLNRFNQAWSESESEFVASHVERYGVYLEFRSQAGGDLVTSSLEDMRSQQIRLCNIRPEYELVQNAITGVAEEKEVVYATVFVANEKRSFFLDKIERYATENAESGKPKNNDLINGIEDLRKAILVSFWQDATALIPNEVPQWCEVWLSSDTAEVELDFVNLLGRLGIVHRQGKIRFPERTVKLVYTNRNQLENLILHSDAVAEFRKAKETADFWVEQPNREQAGWIEDLVSRMNVDRESLFAICILDTGVNSNHPLLQPILNIADCHTYNETWGVHDHKGHGTLMAGVAAFGNLQEHLESGIEVTIPHILESAKILPPEPGRNKTELWGEITSQGISRAEIRAPRRKRIICMAVTSEDTRDHGRPSSWSGAIDQLCSGAEDDKKRLMIVSAGNCTTQDIRNIAVYPSSQIEDSVHDPAQAWNAVSVGAYTQLTELTDPTFRGFLPIAGVNELSPFSTTSRTWDPKWPIKPEVVFEGGNAAVDPSGFVSVSNDLSLISTHYQSAVRHFDSFQMTSAATSLAANFAVQIQARYPHYWPETVRALMIHSAEWPDQLKRQFAQDESKSELSKVLRACGYGVPDLNRAINCASNSLTLVSQAEIQPYEVDVAIKNGKREKKRKTKEMHFYNLPWPVEVLRDLGPVKIEMRVTLSYFIEPGPGEVGWKDRYRYPSHLLRFDVNSPGESRDEFLRRINTAVRDEENGKPDTPSASNYWVIGSQNRDKGSIHSDIWRGTAADLASSNMIAISPRIGWWRERSHLGKVETPTRYALIISIHTPEQDIYTPVAQLITAQVPVEIRTGR